MINKKIYIVILNYNTWQDAIECIESVLNNDYKEFQILLIDNFSPNNSEDKFREWFEGKINFETKNSFFQNQISSISKGPLPFVAYTANYSLKRNIENENLIYSDFIEVNGKACIKNPILFIQTGKNLGFAGGNNVVLRNFINSNENANILLLNPDTFLDKHALRELINYVSPQTFLMGSKIMSYDSPNILNSIGGNKLVKPFSGKNIFKILTDYREINDLDYIYGAAVFLNTETLKLIGPIPEDYFLYWEETDWCIHAKSKGVLLTSCPNSICYDKQGTSIGRGFLAEYFFTYNSMVFYKKHYKKFLISLFFFHLGRFFIQLIKLKYPQAKAIIYAIKDYILRKRLSIKKDGSTCYES